MAAGEMVIVGYRPHPGQAAELERLVADHVPILRRLGLATDRPALAMRAADGTVIEVFEWQPGGIERAHADPQAGALWARFAAVCDYVPLRELPEFGAMFALFTPLAS